jgi:hypothetical protein
MLGSYNSAVWLAADSSVPVEDYCKLKNLDLSEQFLQGFFGRTFSPYWVVSPPFRNKSEAMQFANLLSGQLSLLRSKGWKNDPVKIVNFNDGTFSVAIGYNISGKAQSDFLAAQRAISPNPILGQLQVLTRQQLQDLQSTSCQ